MTETDSDITRGYRGYNEKVIRDISKGYNAGTRDYDSITISHRRYTKSYRRQKEAERERKRENEAERGEREERERERGERSRKRRKKRKRRKRELEQ